MGRVVLDKFARIGDRVKMVMEKEAREWGRKGVPDGVQGTVVGFERYDTYYGRVHSLGRVPGKYRQNAGPVILWDNGEVDQVSSHDLEWLENPEATYQLRMNDKSWNAAWDLPCRIGDLPELPIWEYDWVKVKRGLNSDLPKVMFVDRIDYHWIGETRNDGVTPMPIYGCRPERNNGYSVSLDSTEVELHERGDVWNWTHDRSKLKWKDLKHEVSFHDALGLTTQVKNEKHTGHYGWTLYQVLDAIEAGEVDMFMAGGGFDLFLGVKGPTTPDSDRHYAYKFADEDLGRRVRETTLKGFKDMRRKATH